MQAATGNGALQDDLDKTSLILGLGDIHDSESFDDFQIQADHENCEPVRKHKSKWGRFKWTLGFTAILTATAVFAGFMLFDDSTKADQPFDNKVKQSIVVRLHQVPMNHRPSVLPSKNLSSLQPNRLQASNLKKKRPVKAYQTNGRPKHPAKAGPSHRL